MKFQMAVDVDTVLNIYSTVSHTGMQEKVGMRVVM